MTDLTDGAVHDAAAIITSTKELTLEAAKPQEFDAIPELLVYALPNGESPKVVDLEQYAEFPRRKHSSIQVATTASLAQYLNEHREDGTTVYADEDAYTVTAVINDHGKGSPGHRDHRATLALVQTPACKRWTDAHAKMMSQVEFAQLIEDGLYEIVAPDGATVLEIAQSMQATIGSEFRSANRLTDGQTRFQYTETIDAKAGAAGDLTIPEIITLTFAPFNGSAPITIDARLRYRMQTGKLTLGVWLIRHVEAIRASFGAELDALQAATADIADEHTEGLVALWGKPGS